MPMAHSDQFTAETPLRPSRSQTPLPRLQLFIVLYLQVAEPVTAFVIFPFINQIPINTDIILKPTSYQLIYEYGMTDGDEKKVGYYAGTVISLFFVTETICVYHWGKLSDRVGRRPVLLAGLCGLTLSICCFALSKTFAALMLSRALAGALNGNIGVIKSMMAEITDESNQAQAFSFLSLVVAGGNTLAGFLGGGLSHPYERFPKVFGSSRFWKNYPYALPCFAAASFSVSAFLLAFLFLKESLNSTSRKNPDHVIATSPDVLNGLPNSSRVTPTESTSLLRNSPLPPSLREVLTPQVQMAVLNYGTFSLLNIIYLYLQPLFMSTPIKIGGLGLGAQTIGLILGINGILNGIFVAFFFPPMHRRFGTRSLFIITVVSHFILYLAWPLMSILAKRTGKIDTAVIIVLIVQQLSGTLSNMGFSCINILITSSAPSRNLLGATAGLAQSLSSLVRAIGPATTAALFAFSLEHNSMGGQLVYVVIVSLVSLALVAAVRLPKAIKRASD